MLGPSVCLSPRGGVLLYFHAHVGSGYFWGFKILNFNVFGVFQKAEYFLGYEDFVDTLGSSQNWTIQCILGSFLKV